jgi:hypothetical protein
MDWECLGMGPDSDWDDGRGVSTALLVSSAFENREGELEV